MCVSRVASLLVLSAIACNRSEAPISDGHVREAQAAYVWQRNWTPAVRAAVAHPLAGLDGLHVLTAEVTANNSEMTFVALDAPSLAASHRPITLVVRINGARPIAELSLDPVVARGQALRAAGVDVVGIEVDHDCATARLADYAAWLVAHRPASWRLSITALPTWASGAALAQVAAAVDDIVVQVHAVRAPAIFDGNDAWRDLARFARAVPGRSLRVALPTYGAVVRGIEMRVNPDDLAVFVHRLETTPIAGVDGIVWFRLPVAGDDQTWSAATFARIVEGRAASLHAQVALVARGNDRFDVVASNPSGEVVDVPPVRIRGAIVAEDMLHGDREVRPGQSVVIGWIHGKDLELVE